MINFNLCYNLVYKNKLQIYCLDFLVKVPFIIVVTNYSYLWNKSCKQVNKRWVRYVDYKNIHYTWHWNCDPFDERMSAWHIVTDSTGVRETCVPVLLLPKEIHYPSSHWSWSSRLRSLVGPHFWLVVVVCAALHWQTTDHLPPDPWAPPCQAHSVHLWHRLTVEASIGQCQWVSCVHVSEPCIFKIFRSWQP